MPRRVRGLQTGGDLCGPLPREAAVAARPAGRTAAAAVRGACRGASLPRFGFGDLGGTRPGRADGPRSGTGSSSRARAVNAALRAVARWPRLPVVWALRLYRLMISPMYGQTCRYYPSCSGYALEAVSVHGVVRGGWLAVRRLGRCHPWAAGGVDLVPARRDGVARTVRGDELVDPTPDRRAA